ncbi:MAG: NUDIX hydrolase [Muribaculaceae bacterium]|nr:NUDIX hydrolase [Muribaculaceae bacterium]
MTEAENDNKWRVADSEYLFRRPWLTARRDTVVLPDGRVNSEYYVLEYPDFVNVMAITADGRMLLVRQYRHGIGRMSLELCAGVIEPGEDPLDAAKRELMEETGFGGGTWDKVCELCANSSTTNNITHCYLARGVVHMADQSLDATEDLDPILMDEAEVYRRLRDGEILQATMAAPLWRYFCLKEG